MNHFLSVKTMKGFLACWVSFLLCMGIGYVLISIDQRTFNAFLWAEGGHGGLILVTIMSAVIASGFYEKYDEK